MADDILIDIINLCHTLDFTASRVYRELSACAVEEDLKLFWARMANEETIHVGYWKTLIATAQEGMIPQVFDKPSDIRTELELCLTRAKTLLKKAGRCSSIEDAFVLAYRLEFHLLHPALGTLFQYLAVAPDDISVQEKYDAHLSGFSHALVKYGAVTPAMELLGETILQLWKENRELAIQRVTDSLCGVLNRRGLLNAATPLVHLAKRYGYNVAVMMLDLDDFKRINDIYGHLIGDEVLIAVTAVIKSRLRKSDLIGRFGGEEFLIFLPEVEPDSIFGIAEAIRRRIETMPRAILSTEIECAITVSIGVSQGFITGNVDTAFRDLIKRADDLLYRAKASGKNRVESD